MSKRARHQPGFYARLLNDVCDRGYNSKYRPKVKPTVMGIYEVERIVAKRVKGKAEYFIQWQNYSPSINTWEPAEHLPEYLVIVENMTLFLRILVLSVCHTSLRRSYEFIKTLAGILKGLESTPLGGLVGRIVSFTGVELDKLKNIMLPTAGFARKTAK